MEPSKAGKWKKYLDLKAAFYLSYVCYVLKPIACRVVNGVDLLRFRLAQKSTSFLLWQAKEWAMWTELKTHENGLKSTSACSCMVFLLSFHGLCEHMHIEKIKLVLAKQSKQAKEVSIIRSLFFMPRFYIKSQK